MVYTILWLSFDFWPYFTLPDRNQTPEFIFSWFYSSHAMCDYQTQTNAKTRWIINCFYWWYFFPNIYYQHKSMQFELKFCDWYSICPRKNLCASMSPFKIIVKKTLYAKNCLNTTQLLRIIWMLVKLYVDELKIKRMLVENVRVLLIQYW